MHLSNKAIQLYRDAIIIDGQLGFELDMPWTFTEKWQLVDRYAKADFTALTLSFYHACGRFSIG